MKDSKLVGILNYTPDSFSDGGEYNMPGIAEKRVMEMIENGAKVVDIGAESTRPYARTLSAEEEWHRLEKILPLIIKICHQNKSLCSLDSYHPENQRKAADLGIDWLNDVTGLRNEKFIQVLQDFPHTKILFMHSTEIPSNPSHIISSTNATDAMLSFAKEKILLLEENGINKQRIIFDPGLGFGKDADGSLNIIANCAKFKDLDVEILLGHSRKSFLQAFTDAKPADRDFETAVITTFLMMEGVDYLRVHNVEHNFRAAKIASKIKGLKECYGE